MIRSVLFFISLRTSDGEYNGTEKERRKREGEREGERERDREKRENNDSNSSGPKRTQIKPYNRLSHTNES